MSDVVFWCSTEADHDYCNGKTASSTGFCLTRMELFNLVLRPVNTTRAMIGSVMMKAGMSFRPR